MVKDSTIVIKNNKKFYKNVFFLLLVVFFGSLIIKFYLLPLDLPVNFDGLEYFMYSSDIFLGGELPHDWTPTNNGWPILVSGFFMLFNSDNAMELMQIQKSLSTVIVSLMIFPVYYLCKNFVSKKIALIGAILIVCEPRLILNSFLGVTDSLYVLLIAISLCLFLHKNEKIVFSSFIFVGLSSLVRGEGITLFLALSIMYLIRIRKERFKIILKYLLVCSIFLLIVLPLGLYRIDVIGVDGIFMRTVSGSERFFSDFSYVGYNAEGDCKIVSLCASDENKFESGFSSFLINLIWSLFPTFIIFIPIGLFFILKKRNFQKHTIIVVTCIIAIPALYAYFIGINDTRYFLPLYPLFTIISILGIEKIISRFKNKNFIIVSVISIIFVTSVIFYDNKEPNYDFERQVYGITDEVYSIVDYRNHKGMLDHYFKAHQIIEYWPMKNNEMNIDSKAISGIPNFDSLEDYIDNSREKGLTHIAVDEGYGTKKEFLKYVFNELDDVRYLEKIYDSHEKGFNYHVKVFEIDYKTYDMIKNNKN